MSQVCRKYVASSGLSGAVAEAIGCAFGTDESRLDEGFEIAVILKLNCMTLVIHFDRAGLALDSSPFRFFVVFKIVPGIVIEQAIPI